MKQHKARLLTLFCLSLSLLSLSLPAAAHEEEHETEQSIDCRCETPHNGDEEHEHEHGSENDPYAFREGTPNLLSATVVGADHFDLMFSHNFYANTFPRGSNPAFWFKYSPLEHLQVDAMTSLRSPLELEFGLAYQLLDEYKNDWLNLTPRLSFNTRGNFVGGELSASKYIFPNIWQVGMDARVLSSGAADSINRPVAALGFNTMVRVWKDWHLFGDLVVPLDSELLQRQLLWTAGIKKRIPHSPHILTLYAGNTEEQSLSGRTISSNGAFGDLFRVGFIFSINIGHVSHLPSRLF